VIAPNPLIFSEILCSCQAVALYIARFVLPSPRGGVFKLLVSFFGPPAPAVQPWQSEAGAAG
jgi:hypothetical protein